RGESEGRADDGVARPDPLRHQHHHQRVGAARTAYRVARAAELRELGFERSYFGAEDELTVAEHARNGRIDRAPEPAPLRGKIDERDGRGSDADTLVRDRQCIIPLASPFAWSF